MQIQSGNHWGSGCLLRRSSMSPWIRSFLIEVKIEGSPSSKCFANNDGVIVRDTPFTMILMKFDFLPTQCRERDTWYWSEIHFPGQWSLSTTYFSRNKLFTFLHFLVLLGDSLGNWRTYLYSLGRRLANFFRHHKHLESTNSASLQSTINRIFFNC